MGLFITRRPILNPEKQILEYETSTYSIKKYDINELEKLTTRLKDISTDKKTYVNIHDDIFKKGLINIFPNDTIGISILDNQGDTEKIKYICQELKKRGLSIMVGDFILNTDPEPFIDLVDIVKIKLNPFLSAQERIKLNKLKESDIILVATGVDTEKDYYKAIHEGFVHLQGEFYRISETSTSNNIPAYKLHYFNLLREINQPEPDFDKIELIIKQDLSLSYNLFRLVNSAYFGLRHQVKSIKQALVLLGLNDYKKWLTLKIMRGISEDKPNILIINSLIRANFAEKLASLINMEHRKLDLFLMGLFSLIDSFLGRPLNKILAELPLSSDTREAILNEKGIMGNVFKLITAYEQGNWDTLIEQIENMNLNSSKVTDNYFSALEATNQVISALNY